MPIRTQPELLQSAITETVIRSFFDIYNDLGTGFLESVYERALANVLTEVGLAVERQTPIKVCFRGNEVGTFRADMVVNQAVILEL